MAVATSTSQTRARPLSSRSGHEALGEHALERAREARGEVGEVLAHGEEAAHGARHVGRADAGEDEVAELGGVEGGLERVGGAEVGGVEHVGVLQEGRAEPGRERGHVDADGALGDAAAAVFVEVLDGLLEGDDVAGVVLVEVADERRHGGAPAGAGGAREEHQAALLLDEGGGGRRQPQVGRDGDGEGDAAHHHGERAALPEGADAEAAQPRRLVREDPLVGDDGLGTDAHAAEDADGGLRVFGVDFVDAEEHEVPADARARRLADLEVDVAGAGGERLAEDLVEESLGSKRMLDTGGA